MPQARPATHLRDDLLSRLPPDERRALAATWAHRAVREHAARALEEAGHASGARALLALGDVTTPAAALRTTWRCLTVGLSGLCHLLARALVVPGAGTGPVRRSAQALHALLDAARAALIAMSATGTYEVRLVADHVVAAARNSRYDPEALPTELCRSPDAGCGVAAADHRAEEELRAQREELALAASVHEASSSGPLPSRIRRVPSRRRIDGEGAASAA